MISVFNRAEKIVCKGEIACTSNFSFSHNVFKRLPSQTFHKLSLCGNGLKSFFLNNHMFELSLSVMEPYPPNSPPPTLYSSVSCIQDLRTGGRFDPWHSQYSFRGSMIIIATGFNSLSHLSFVLVMVMWLSSQWLGNNIVWYTSKKNSRKAWTGALAVAILLK